MRDLLYLSHRVPFPPDKGDKIRSYHALTYLAQRFKIHLGCFVDDTDDEEHLPALRALCETLHAVPLKRRGGLVRGLCGFATGASFSENYFRDARMSSWVAGTMHRVRPKTIFVYSSAMAPYAMPYRSAHCVIADMVDVDSQKWLAYGARALWPMSFAYRLESRRLLSLERGAALAFDHCLFVSRAEAETFLRLVPEAADRVACYENGVDLDYFDPRHSFPSPFDEDRQAIVFTGTMNYRPNIDAAEWFALHVLPSVRAVKPQAEFWIVGNHPAARVVRLSQLPSVHVTGRVQDVRPYLAHAACIVAPLQIARGVQNKILEAMAMAKPLVATPQAQEGIHAISGEDLLLAEAPSAFSDAVTSILDGRHPGLGSRARKYVEANHDWTRTLKTLDTFLGEPSPSLLHEREVPYADTDNSIAR